MPTIEYYVSHPITYMVIGITVLALAVALRGKKKG